MGPDSRGHYDSSIRLAIDSAVTYNIDTIYFPAGKYMLGLYQIPEKDTLHFYCLKSPVNVRNLAAVPICSINDGLVFLGDGYNSIIKLDNYQPKDSCIRNGNYHLFGLINSSNISFLNLLLDGNIAKNSYDEQRHLVQVEGSSNIKFKKVFFKDAKGDGIKLVGISDSLTNTPIYTRNISVDSCVFSHNGRSGITLHRFVKDVAITNNLFSNSCDQDIDLEPNIGSDTEEELTKIRNVTIVGNRFEKIDNGLSVTLRGADSVMLRKNTFVNSTLKAYTFLHNALIDNNRFINKDLIVTENNPKILMMGDMNKIEITYNHIEDIIKLTDTTALAAIQITTDSIGPRLGNCESLLVRSNKVSGHIIINEVKNIFFQHNRTKGNSGLDYPGLHISNTIVKTDTILVSSDTITHFDKSIVFDTCESLSVYNNFVSGHISINEAKNIFFSNNIMSGDSGSVYPGLRINNKIVTAERILISGNTIKSFGESLEFVTTNARITGLTVSRNKFHFFKRFAIYYNLNNGDKIDGIPEFSDNEYIKTGVVPSTSQIETVGYIRGFHVTSNLILFKRVPEQIILTYKPPGSLETELRGFLRAGFRTVYHYTNYSNQNNTPIIKIYTYQGRWQSDL